MIMIGQNMMEVQVKSSSGFIGLKFKRGNLERVVAVVVVEIGHQENPKNTTIQCSRPSLSMMTKMLSTKL